jgi:hypothetical protein
MKARRFIPVVALALAGAAAVACAPDSSASAQAPSPPANPDQVVAEVGGRSVTLKELDARWEEFDAPERARVTQMLYQNRRNVLEQMVGDMLIEGAAKAAGQTVEAFVAADAAKRMKPVTEAEVAQFYEQNKERAQGRTLDELRQQINDFLSAQRQQQTRAQLVDELKTKNASGVKVLLEPPRYTMTLAEHDPIRGDKSAPITVVEYSDYQ